MTEKLAEATLGIRRELELSYAEALEKIPAALKEEGFGVLTEIDVQETLKNKLDVDFRPYKILGACNPPFAHRALQARIDVGLLMPCNVIVYEDERGKATVNVVDPMQTIGGEAEPELKQLAAQVREKLERVVSGL